MHKQLSVIKISRNFGKFASNTKVFFVFSDVLSNSDADHSYVEF